MQNEKDQRVEHAKTFCTPSLQEYLHKAPGQGLGVIYLMINTVTKLMYVGQHRHGVSGRSVQKRFTAHFNSKTHSHLYNSIRAHGRSAFECFIIDHCSEADLNEKEIFFIAHLQTKYPLGYNNEKGGGGAAKSERGLDALRKANRDPEKRSKSSVPWSRERKEKALPNMKAAQNRPGVRAANSTKSKKHWATPGAREAQGGRAKAWYDVPGNREAISKTRKELMATDEYKRRRWEGVLKRRQIALANCTTDDERRKLQKRHEYADALHKRRGHPDFS